MGDSGVNQPELINIITWLAGVFKGTPLAGFLLAWQDTLFSLFIAALIVVFFYIALRKIRVLPGRAQAAAEIFVEVVDDFVCGIMGSRGRRFVPFIGTLFIYILLMNICGLIPFLKSATTNWSITLALSLCVFVYVQYTAFKELGVLGYFDVLMDKPRGFLALSVVFPLMMFFLHLVSELIKPITLSLRLRSNIWGDDMLLAVLSGFGLTGLPLLLFSSVIALIAAVVQATVFCLLTTIYFAFVLSDNEEIEPQVKGG